MDGFETIYAKDGTREKDYAKPGETITVKINRKTSQIRCVEPHFQGGLCSVEKLMSGTRSWKKQQSVAWQRVHGQKQRNQSTQFL